MAAPVQHSISLGTLPDGLASLAEFVRARIEGGGLGDRLELRSGQSGETWAGSHCLAKQGAAALMLCPAGAEGPPADVVAALAAAWRDLHELEHEQVRLLEELAVDWESFQALYDLSADLQSDLDHEELLRRILRRMTASLRQGSAVLLLARRGVLAPAVWVNAAGPGIYMMEKGLVGRVVREQKAIVLNERAKIAATAGLEEIWADATGIALAPITMPRRGLFGIMAVWTKAPAPDLNSHLVRLLETLGQQTALVVESDRLARTLREGELLQQELQIGSLIQQILLVGETPRHNTHYDVATMNLASQTVDGDFLDVFPQEDGRLGVLIGDVMGKGIPAALIGAATKNNLLRAMAEAHHARGSGDMRIDAIVNRASARMTPTLIAVDRFVTLEFALFNPFAGTVDWVDCGHTGTVHYHAANRRASFLKGEGLPVGVLEGEGYQAVSTPMEPGDLLLFYSDGVTEARDAHGTMFGEERLAAVVAACADRGSRLLLDEIRRQVIEFGGTEVFADDFTCLAVRQRPELERPASTSTLTLPASLSCLPDLHRWYSEFLATPGTALDGETADLIRLGLVEAATNIIRHACLEDPAKRWTIYAAACPDRWVFEFEDEGAEWGEGKSVEPVFDGSRAGGFGVYILEQVMDCVNHLRLPDGRNLLLLTRYRDRNRGGCVNRIPKGRVESNEHDN
jgi:phosphoserine phosphatase RsbU/P